MTASLTTAYNLQLVVVSVLIAVLAAYTAIALAERVAATQSRTQALWLVGGAVAMGTGIWSMHFIGMLAFRLPVLVYYDFLTVFVSVLPAIVASGIALFLVSRPTLGWLQLSAGSLWMGVGIASMHYIGMAAMNTTATVSYDAWLVALSVAIAIAVSYIGLFLFFQFRENTQKTSLLRQKLLAAIFIGTAISTMHYTGMAAAGFIAPLYLTLPEGLQPPKNIAPLTAAVLIGTLVLLGLALLTAFFERRLSAQTIYAQASQDSKQYLKTILQGIQVGVLVIEDHDQIRLSNQAMLDLLHLSTETQLQNLWEQSIFTSQEVSTSLDDQLLQSIQPIVQKIVAKQPVHNEVVYITPATQLEPTALLVNLIPLNPPKSSETQMICTFNEVTELKQTANQLKASEAKYRDLATQEELLNHLSTQVRQSLDLHTILQTAVCEVRKFFETDRALIYQFTPNWHGQVILEDVAEPWSPTLGETADDCFPEECLERYRDGKTRAINNIDEAELDSRHRQFLERLQVKANLIVPIVVSHQLWGLLIVHQCSRPRLWQEEKGQLLSRLASQLGIAIQQSELYSKAEQSALQAQAQAQELRESEAQLKQKTQTLQQTLQDIQSLQLQLVQSEKMSSLGQLVAGVAHEINNPVSFIYGNLVHLQDYVKNVLGLIALYQKHYPNPVSEIQDEIEAIDLAFIQDDLAKVVSSMNMGTDRIRQIVLSLRNFSRMDEANFQAVAIHEGIDSTLMILQHRCKASAKHPDIDVIRDYTPLPLVECYPGQLNQVFMNILTNAIDALQEYASKQASQGIKTDTPNQIVIRTSAIDNQWARIAIANNGPAIPDQVKERIFNPFFTTKPIGKGTGMGLSISYQIIVEKHNGKLDCFSKPNQGTEFVIQIPIQQI
ncbi:MHYT domain-containing protein [Leptothoe spongobia]|uniref:histidine kinase n=1 Tax=Leptothoe spongobia TAU-MAC 1115 TaxID=1967444 RepID=A0A947DD45_9CYAN|nr:MHYT domain-containing protein [Leptothoe spongobia]MBT9314715.1 GAF domain-containing protein [Leptothoe spongobia TAU-MAC 1115]